MLQIQIKVNMRKVFLEFLTLLWTYNIFINSITALIAKSAYAFFKHERLLITFYVLYIISLNFIVRDWHLKIAD